MITRYHLIQAIYDNNDEWSCQSPCPHRMEEKNPECVCYECAKQKLKEYEDSIRKQTIDEFMRRTECKFKDHSIYMRIMEEIAEQMKGEEK